MSNKNTKEKLPEQPNNTEDKKPNGAPKRQKIVKACKDCRRRKVKCDGGMPCGTCRRSMSNCIFEPSSPKRGATKHYIESLENRINVIERALNTLDNPTMKLVKEAMLRQQLIEEGALGITQAQDFLVNPEDRFLINEFGSPAYIQDISNNLVDYRYLQHPDSQSNCTSSPKSMASSSNTSSSVREDGETENHLQFYIKFIQPYFPIFVPSYFNCQYLSNEIPSILIYAICALGAYFQNSGEDEYYYQKAMIMLDEAAGRPSVHLVQALLLLIKYMECTKSQLFFEKTKNLITRTIEMCKILKLHQLVINSNQISPDPDLETKKRTFCMVFVYNTLLCVEQGIESDLVNTYIKDPVALLPSTLPDESTVECQRYIISFSFTLSKIHQHLLRVTQRREVQKEMRNDAQIIEENMALLQLQVMIENDLMHLPPNLCYHHTNKIQHQQFPAEEELATNSLISPMTRLLHMIYHLNVMLLHYHYYMHPLPQGTQEKMTNYPHRQMCLSSASIMIRLIEGLVIDSLPSFQYAPRGAQFVLHCVTFALTILNVEKSIAKDNKAYLDEYQRCVRLAQHVTPTSPSQEMCTYASELNVDYDMVIDPQPLTTNTTTTTTTTTTAAAATTTTATTTANTTANTTASIASTTPTPKTAPKRRNTITHSYPMVPQSLLQSSSADVNQFTFPHPPPPPHHHHQPLHNIHTAPLHVQTTMNPPIRGGRTLLRGSTQSCQDLRSMSQQQQQQQDVFTQHRKPVSSVITSSTTSTNPGPYRHYNTNTSTTTGSRHGSPSSPYNKPMYDVSPHTSQSSNFPRQQQQQQQPIGKVRRIKKSQSIHGLSSNMRQQQHVYQPMLNPQQQQQLQQQMNHLFYTPQQQQQQQQLHRPYQPSLDDDFKLGSNDLEQFPMNVDLTFLNNFSLNISTTNDRVEGHQLL